MNLLRLKLLVKSGKLTEAFEMFGAQLTLLVCLFVYLYIQAVSISTSFLRVFSVVYFIEMTVVTMGGGGRPVM